MRLKSEAMLLMGEAITGAFSLRPQAKLVAGVASSPRSFVLDGDPAAAATAAQALVVPADIS
jgi:hypothetical protein